MELLLFLLFVICTVSLVSLAMMWVWIMQDIQKIRNHLKNTSHEISRHLDEDE